MIPAQEENKIVTEEKVKEKLTYALLIKQIVLLSKELFIISLIFYLILFVLETIFPGFVSYNFNLNWALGLVVLLGLISAFGPDEKKEEGKKKPKIFDYLMSVFFGILGGLIIFTKINLDPSIKLTVTIFATLLIIGTSIVLLTVEEKVVKEKEEEIEQFVQKTFLSRETFIYPVAFLRLILFKKINFPMVLILFVFIFSILSLPGQKGYETRNLDFSQLTAAVADKNTKLPKSSNSPLESSSQASSDLGALDANVRPSADLLIKVFNGSSDINAAENFARILKDLGYVKVFFGNADRKNYRNVEIIFRPEDEKQAKLIKGLLEKNYAIIKGTPSASASAEISIILGNSKPEEDTSSSSL